MMIQFTNCFGLPKEGWGRRMFYIKIHDGEYIQGVEITIFYITIYMGNNFREEEIG